MTPPDAPDPLTGLEKLLVRWQLERTVPIEELTAALVPLRQQLEAQRQQMHTLVVEIRRCVEDEKVTQAYRKLAYLDRLIGDAISGGTSR